MLETSSSILSKIVKKISLNKCIEEEDIETIVKEFWKQVGREMSSEKFNKILIHNFGTFVPNPAVMNKMMQSYEKSGKDGYYKEVITKNINKQFKSKRKCCTQDKKD